MRSRLSPAAAVLAGLAAVLLWTRSTGAPPSSSAQAEIEHLIAYVGGSSCEFNRNGLWYTGGQAREHLQEKFALVLRRGPVRTAEEFISVVATRSLFTGLAYKVRCQGASPLAVDDWLLQVLRIHRACAAATLRCPAQPGAPPPG